MKLSVVIVHSNEKYFLAQCLHSLLKALQPISAEVIVVDNASTDDSQSYIKRLFPQVCYIYNTDNVGFVCANNQALHLCQGDYILLLHPDTLLPEDNIQQVIRFFDVHSEAGVCGVKMHAGNGYFLPESKRRYPSASAYFWHLSGISQIFPHQSWFDDFYLSRYSSHEVHPVSVLASPYMMMRRDTIEKTGLFDEDFSVYGEDLDLSCRMEEAGYTNYYLPYPILHYKNDSAKKLSTQYIRSVYGAMHTFFRKRSYRYNSVTRVMQHASIHMQYGMKQAAEALRRNISQFMPVHQLIPRYFIFAHEDSVLGIRKLLKKNHLNGPHHIMIANERSTAQGHDIVIPGKNGFTHVVYDSRVFSYKKMLDLLTGCKLQGVQLGVYHPQYHILVTPGKNYF